MSEEITRWWGPWALQGTDLVYKPGQVEQYPVDLLTCTTSAQVLDWICQITGRRNPESLEEAEALSWFVHALNDILDPQANLCSFGKSSSISRDDMKKAISRVRRP